MKTPNNRHAPATALLLLALAPLPAAARSEATVDEIRAEIAALRREYDARLAALEARLERLEQVAPAVSEVMPDEQSARDRLREAARLAAAETATAVPASIDETAPAVGRERNLNRLNPEISMTGIVLANASNRGREEFRAQEFELDLQAALDPFSRTRWTLAVGDEGVEVEEGYVVYSSLPGGLELTAGKFRQRFGPLNRQHLHALPQSDYPLVYQRFFGEEGLAQTGLSFAWLLPRPWATANEVVIQITDGENEIAFGGESFEDLAVLARLKNFWELSAAAYFEWGLSGITGRTAEGGDSHVLGTDVTYSWQPPGRAKYRGWTWRAELLRAEREELDGRRRFWGGYTYLEGLLRRNLFAGLRFDRAQDPLADGRRLRGLVPYLTWWQSEYVRLRAELGLLEDELSKDRDNRFTLQLTWAAGPHKHETY